jgi:uncharacterized protein
MENVFSKAPASKPWHYAWMVGCYQAAFIYITATGGLTLYEVPLYFFLIAGFLVGFGARLGSGCTSGHGICGLSRFNLRSFVAVGTFMATAVITANLTHHSNTYSFSSGTSMNSAAWLSSSEYLGWPMFTIGAMAVLSEIWDVFYPAAGKREGEEEGAAKKKAVELVVLWLCGGIFGIGLSLGGMIDNGVVLNFLTFNNDWNPSLMFVLGFSVMTFGSVYWYKHFSDKAKETEHAAGISLSQKQQPTAKKVDWQLVAGSALFGIGWGLAGICPAPAVTILCTPTSAVFFFPTLYIGMKAVVPFSAYFDVKEESEEAQPINDGAENEVFVATVAAEKSV